MRTFKMPLLTLALLALGLTSFASGQLASQARPAHRSLGYYDPATGIFEPLRPLSDAETPVTPTTGTLTFSFTISAKTAVPTNGVISCQVTADISDASYDGSERAVGIATLESGTTYKCSAVMHYSWPLTSASSDKIGLSYTAGVEYGYQVTATNGTSVAVEPITGRETTQEVPSISVPANGASTTEDVSITL